MDLELTFEIHPLLDFRLASARRLDFRLASARRLDLDEDDSEIRKLK